MRDVSIGIDPGLSGAVAILGLEARPIAWPLPLAGKELDAARLSSALRAVMQPDCRIVVTIEKAQPMPKQGVSSVGSYLMGYGMLRGVVAALGLRCELVRPTSWKAVVLADSERDKTAAIAYVARAFPGIDLYPGKKRKAHDGIADAVCIAEFASRRFFTHTPTLAGDDLQPEPDSGSQL